MAETFGHNLSHENFIAAPPEKVYATITSGDDWNRFFTHATTIDPRPGGEIVWRWKDWGPRFYTTSADGRVLAAEAGKRFAFEWYPVGREHPTTVEFTLEAAHDGTILRVTESGYPDTEAGRDMILECACGWGEAITLLKFYIEHGIIYTPPQREG